MNALAINTHDMVRQLAFPLVPERRVKGALHLVSRDTGVSYSKLRKIYYALTDHILAVEWEAIRAAYQRYVERQEEKLEAELAQLRALKASRLQRGLFDVDTQTHANASAQTMDMAANQD